MDKNPVIDQLVARYREQPGALLPLLHALQQEFGYIPDAAIAKTATALNRSQAEVHGVISYYHFFRREPAGRHVVQVCRAESCQACGADALLDLAAEKLGCARNTTRADGAVTLEPVYCLGLCAASPAVRVDERLYGRMDADRLAGVLSQFDDVEPVQ